ncbi:MAG: FMN-dependent NADH-azoreductase [Bacilli bacterium]
MTNLLYVSAHPLTKEHSYSLAVGEAFLDAYKQHNPEDAVQVLDVYKEGIPMIDADVFTSWGVLSNGGSFEQLSSEQQEKITKLGEIVDRFMKADKIVVVNPVWNFGTPPPLKAFLDAICVAGKTFAYTENGPVGLVEGKKVLHIQASGSVLSEGPYAALDHSHPHIKTVFGFIGVTDVEALFVEGHSQNPAAAADIRTAAIERAKSLAEKF